MASGTFERSNLDWQIQQLQQHGGEQLDRFWQWIGQLLAGHENTSAEAWELPDWLLKGLFWLVVVGCVAWAGWQLYKFLNPYLDSYLQAGSGNVLRGSATQAKEQTTTEWLQRSRLAQQQGNYREGCRMLYMAALQHLNDQALIHQEPSRTDGEYLSLVRRLDQSQPFQILIGTHERLCFSEAAISAEMFDRCWQAYQEINRT